jgi:hypothetical protein
MFNSGIVSFMQLGFSMRLESSSILIYSKSMASLRKEMYPE